MLVHKDHKGRVSIDPESEGSSYIVRAGGETAGQGTVYTSCTPDHDPGSELWCSTRVDTRGEHVPNGGHWGFCGDTCLGHAGAGDTHAEIQLVSNDIDEGELADHILQLFNLSLENVKNIQ